MIDLSEHPVVDSHCHAFLPEKETGSFERYLNLSDLPIPREDVANTFIYRQVVRELSRLLDVDGPHEEVVEERRRRYRRDPVGYIRLLFEDAGIETLLVDTGYPSREFSGYSVDLADFSRIVPCEVREIFRIEPLLFELLQHQPPFDALVEQFHERIREAVKGGAVALKSVVAYRTGLEIRRRPEDDVREAYRAFAAEGRPGRGVLYILLSGSREIKTLMDYFVFLAVEDSVELDVPLQIHVGMGDAPMIDLRTANPILLRGLIDDESAREARIILTHGGYPYIEEAGFLVNSYPNVFLDLSETIPFITIGVREKLLNLFEMAPTTKLMYGSDGYNIPELHWIAAIRARKALAAALNGLLESGEVDEGWAYEIAEQFLSGNARRIYKL